ncbi:hypothetical protein [Amycolatopsis sp. FDAARGOS 1241]|uniref:hypothetical protein n=1 Tax=Amycolatopsis sp. FDAARGOS 1241 TaxID=2778070 RepID=UPI001951CE62|nr:hypothetical protein [Amycolatopsis sp. FDAARGOS 1241]QRP47805.1 hypothetical protein I6J71_07760 [Amycolatopsis sp. FDAARGOS 1241]
MALPRSSGAVAPEELGAPDGPEVACSLLGADELQRGLSDGAVYESVEQPPQSMGGVTGHGCEYRRPGTHEEVAALVVLDATVLASPEDAFTGAARSCSDEPKPFTDDAVYCTSARGGTTITIAKRSHGKVRVAQLAFVRGPSDAFLDGYSSLTKTVAGRL